MSCQVRQLDSGNPTKWGITEPYKVEDHSSRLFGGIAGFFFKIGDPFRGGGSILVPSQGDKCLVRSRKDAE